MDTPDIITSNLNQKQLQAVTTTEGYVRVTAGAGSGKTKALAHRYAYIVEELGISPSNVLCVTFTNKAAQEMRKRVSNLVTDGNVNDFICTYHGFCVKFLREEIHRLCFQQNFVILDDEDQKSILRGIYQELGINSTDMTYNTALDQISGYKNMYPDYIQYLLPVEVARFEHGVPQLPPLVELYFRNQLKLTALDFDDLINFTLYILETYPDAAEKWQKRFHYIMVDETQDNNSRNWGLANILSAKHKNLFIVGDPDQAIYEWRGAMPDFFINFDKTHSPCTDIIMDENYRSTPNILNVANSVIDYNKNRIKKDLFTRKQEGSTVIHFHGKNEVEEGKWISDTILKLIENGANPSQFAILYRASHISRYIEQALITANLKYTVYGGIRFFERKEIKDALSYLRLVAYGDDLSFLRIVNTPSRKIGDVFKQKLAFWAEDEGKSLYETLKAHIHEEPFNKMTSAKFVDLIEECREKAHKLSISDLLDSILKKSGLKDMLRLDGDQGRLENIEELMNSIKLYEETNKEEEDLSVDRYLQDIALYTNLDYKEDGATIKLMTIHQSKGLEFPYVFVGGMIEGIFPSHKSVRERKIRGLEEERRLAYVAFTRAETALFLTESEGYNFSTRTDKYPSRFLNEITKEYYVVEGTIPDNIIHGARSIINRLDEEISGNANTYEFAKGDLVEHPVFGIGEVQSVNDKEFQYIIRFYNFEEEKPIAFAYRKLKALSENGGNQ